MKHFAILLTSAVTFVITGWSQTAVDSEEHTTLETTVLSA